MKKSTKDLIAFLRLEAAACKDLARIHGRMKKPKKDVRAFERKAALLAQAADELEAA